ncbi:MAG: J domain-containing protein [Bacteroidaceae bacterium]|jgi:DnaJ-domain-containing protein 1|nr:J domain-containing protein [Bacteroidaceae bacterium]
MGCLISYKWLFGLIGLYVGGGRGFILGFLLGWLLDSMYRRPTIHFTFQHGHNDDFSGYQKEERKWQPYVDVTLQEAYRTLGIRETATDDEVRQAYRQMALRYHPDRVSTQGEAAREEAEKKFREATEARDTIFRARGL